MFPRIPQPPKKDDWLQRVLDESRKQQDERIQEEARLLRILQEQWNSRPNPQPLRNGTASLRAETSMHLSKDARTDTYRLVVWLHVGSDKFTLYDGVFPPTDHSILQHFSTLVEKSLTQES